MEPDRSQLKQEVAQAAARIVVEEGLDYGPAKRRAIRQLGLPARTALPGNDELEDAVFEYIALFCAESQALELAALRRLALGWMLRMESFRPYLSGAVWRGTATRRSNIHIDLFCDDSKSAEIALIDHQIRYEPGTAIGLRGDAVDVLGISDRCRELNEDIGIHLYIYDHDDLRGALRPDTHGRPPRGELAAVRALVAAGDKTP